MSDKNMPTEILIIDSQDAFCLNVKSTLLEHGFDVKIAATIEEATPVIEAGVIDLVIKDSSVPSKPLFDKLTKVRSGTNKIPVIMATDKPQIQSAVESFKYGAVDYLIKPVSDEKLVETVTKALELYSARRNDHTVEMKTSDLTVAGYKVKRILGEGSMGIVYLVEDKDEGEKKEYAIKVLKPLSADESVSIETLKKRFSVEAQAAFTVQHPNIVKFFDYGTCENEMPYILMEYCPGKALDLLIPEDNLSLKEKCLILRQLASALEAIHEKGICHRDVKPGNIIVQDDMTIKLTDFGIARLSNSNLTITSEVFGTPAYLSPEAFESAKVDWRADIFSFGSMAYELFTGKRPFLGENLAIVATNIIKGQPIWPRKLDPKFPKILEYMLRKTMQKLPEDRFDGAYEMYLILNDYLEGREESSYYTQAKGPFSRLVSRK